MPLKLMLTIFWEKGAAENIFFFQSLFQVEHDLVILYATNHAACDRDEHCVQLKPKYDQ